nr:hypothetical protein [Pyrinomonadaceae bacterium]
FRANTEKHDAVIDADDFVLVTNLNLFTKALALDEPINIALQEGLPFLRKNKNAVDDGSMSIYFGMNYFGKTNRAYDYINIEAEGKDDTEDDAKARQTRLIRLINKLKV